MPRRDGSPLMIKGRSPLQKEIDLGVIAQLYIRGLTQPEIIKKLAEVRDYAVTQATISRDLKTIQYRWLNTYIKDFNEHQVKELAHIDELERAYWEEYQNSKEPKVEAYAEKVEDTHTYTKDGSDETTTVPVYSRTKTRTKKTERDASAAFLAGIERCIEMRAKILGLFAPTKIDVSWRKQAKAAGIDPELVIDGLVKNIVATGGMPTGLLPGNNEHTA